jgi:hypothetical protein
MNYNSSNPTEKRWTMMMGAAAAANDEISMMIPTPQISKSTHPEIKGCPFNAQAMKEADTRRRRPLMARTK